MKLFNISRLPVLAILLLPGLLSAQDKNETDLSSSYKNYLNTYEQSPLAANDYITGSTARTAAGSVINNDSDPAGKKLTAYLVTSSPDGTLTLSENGDFSFIPHTNFSGSSTSFSYKVCNNSLCSETATVTLVFPQASMIPVMLVDFKANYHEGDHVVLNWSTSFENNNERWEVERSLDGVHFTTVGSIKGQGTTNITHHYSFTNKVARETSLKNDIYYRLKQVTLDERVSTSKILIVRVYKTRSLELVSVTPNPAVNDIKVNVQLNENSYVVMKVLNQSGVSVIRKEAKSNAGLNSYTLEGSSSLEKGIYFLEMIVNSKERMLVKLMKD